jgi:CheY-like chemotaxis protein
VSILIVDHDPWSRELAAEIIESLGYLPLSARNAKEAFEIARGAGRILALLTAVMLPNTNGLELAASLRRRFPNLKVIYMSGPNDSVSVRGTIHPGSAAVKKPFKREELAYEIGVLLGEANERRPA